MTTAKGSRILSLYNGLLQSGWGAWLALYLHKQTGFNPAYLGLQRDLLTHVPAPTGLGAAASGAGVLNGAYVWAITSVDGAGGESLIGTTAALSPVNQKVLLTWVGSPLASSYNLYRTFAGVPGTYYLVASIAFGTNSFTDNVPDAGLGTQNPPAVDNTQVTQWYIIPPNSYGASNILATLPAAGQFSAGRTYGGVGGGVPIPISGSAGPNSSTVLANLGGGDSPWSVSGQTASCVLFIDSGTLAFSGYKFSIPAGATILGIVVNIFCQATYPSQVNSSTVQLTKAGVPAGVNRGGSTPTWPSPSSSITYGANNDLWGTAWTPADLNNAGFGVRIAAHNNGTPFQNISESQVTITVYYSVAGVTVAYFPSPNGGLPNALSPIPQIVQFLDHAIAALGNGYNPLHYDQSLPLSGSNPEPLQNTFAPIYAKWVASTVYVSGNIVVASPDNGHFFVCVQGGVSGTLQPTWNTATKGKTSDGSIVWQEAGSTAATPAPRGAAHAVVHLGCLWVANTSPQDTSDNLDGPSCIRQSDVNNHDSWNPVNVAFLARNDGTQIMGMTPFTIGEFGIAPTPSLVVFKDFTTFQIIGLFGSSNFSIQLAQTDMGCVAPRTIIFIPGFGVARLAHLGIAIFDGVKDRLISEDIRPYIFGDPGSVSDIQAIDQSYSYLSKAAQTANPPMYVMAVPVTGTTEFVGANPINNVQMAAVAGTGWAAGTYYFVVQGTDASGNLWSSSEISLTLGANQVPQLVNFDASNFTFGTLNIYYGTVSGQEAQYQPIPILRFVIHGQVYLSFNLPFTLRAFTSGTAGSTATGTGTLTRILCFDLITKAWTIVDLPWPISVLTQVRAQGTEPLTIIGNFSDGSMRRWQATDLDWDGTPISWSVRSPEVFEKASSQRMYFRKVIIRGVFQRVSANLQVVITVNGVDGRTNTFINYQEVFGDGQFEMEFPIHATGLNAHVTVSGNAPIELQEFDWDVAPKPVVATPSI